MTNAFSNLETTVRNIVKEAGPTPDATALANSVVSAVKNVVGELEGQVSALASEAENLRSELQLKDNELLELKTAPEVPASPNDQPVPTPTEEPTPTPTPVPTQAPAPSPTVAPSTGTEPSDTLAGG